MISNSLIIKVESAYKSSLEYMFENDFYSHDPYDGLNTQAEFLKRTKLSRLGLVYFNKFSPVNCRKLFGVQKSRSVMGLATIANAMLTRNKLDEKEAGFVDDLYLKLKKQTLKQTYGYHCWSVRSFPIQMRTVYHDSSIPRVIGSEIFGDFLIKYHNYSGNDEALEYLSDLADLIADKFYCEKNGFSFFKYCYSDSDDKITINGSLKAAALLMKASEVLDINKYDDKIVNVFDTAVKLQKKDGHWPYTYYIDSNDEKHQIDFHQGFVLDDILLFMDRYGHVNPYLECYQKGLEFFYNKQFLRNGQSIYRYPKKWPVNIHSQAQGIITFTKAGQFETKYSEFAQTIADWTIEYMQDKKYGYFYYLKYPFFTNKIPYFRWNDANMLLALSVLLAELKATHVEV